MHQKAQHNFSRGQPGHLGGHGEVLIENFIKKHNFEGMGPLEETSFELQGLQGRLPTSKDRI